MPQSHESSSETTAPKLAFSCIHTTIKEPPETSPLAASSPGIAALPIADTDPLAKAVQLPNNYLSLDSATQTNALLFAAHAYLTDPSISSWFARTHTTQQHLTAELIAAHGPALHYLDALNRVKAKREELATFLDTRAPGGRCTREWRLEEAERLMGELEGCVRQAREVRDRGKMGAGKEVGMVVAERKTVATEEEAGRAGQRDLMGGRKEQGRSEARGEASNSNSNCNSKKKQNAWAKAFAEL